MTPGPAARRGIRLLEAVHAPASARPGEDALGFRAARGELHLWVVDGATSVSQVPNRYRPDMTDAAWFARALSAAIWQRTGNAALTPAALAEILRRLSARYRARCGTGLPPWDPPVAAMTYVRIRPQGRRHRLDALHYADCFLLVVPGGDVRCPRAASNWPTLPRRGSLPADPALLARLRTRRAAQNTEGAGSALSLDPASAFRGRAERLARRGPALVLVGSDGIARLWQEYRLATPAAVARAVARHGALRQVSALRRWEDRHEDHGRSPKPADDAALLSVLLPAPGGRHAAPRRWRASAGNGTRRLLAARTGHARAPGMIPDPG